MPSTDNHSQHHQALIETLYQHCQATLPFSSEQASETDREFLDQLQSLSEAQTLDEHAYELGQSLLCRIVGHYQHITPAINRDLFWFFGGDCLHFMSDEEINHYQQLDELLFEKRTANEAVDYPALKATVFKLH